MRQGEVRVRLKRLTGGGARLFQALRLNVEERFLRLHFTRGEAAAGVIFRVGMNRGRYAGEIKSLLPGVGFHGGGEFLQIAEDFCGGVQLVTAGIPRRKKSGKELPLACAGIRQQVVNNGPGFRVEDRGAILFVVIGRIRAGLHQRVHGNQAGGLQHLQVIRRNFTDFNFLVVNGGVGEIFGEAFAEPDGKSPKVQVHDGVRVFVVDDFVGIVGFDVGANRDVVAGLAWHEDSRGVQSPFCLPIRGQEEFQGVFVLYREDDQWLAEVHAEFREGVVKDFAELFELIGDFPRLVFTGVAYHLEMGRLDFDPRVFRIDAEGARNRESGKAQAQENRRFSGEPGEHEETLPESRDESSAWPGHVSIGGEYNALRLRIHWRGELWGWRSGWRRGKKPTCR